MCAMPSSPSEVITLNSCGCSVTTPDFVVALHNVTKRKRNAE